MTIRCFPQKQGWRVYRRTDRHAERGKIDGRNFNFTGLPLDSRNLQSMIKIRLAETLKLFSGFLGRPLRSRRETGVASCRWEIGVGGQDRQAPLKICLDLDARLSSRYIYRSRQAFEKSDGGFRQGPTESARSRRSRRSL